MTEALTLLEDEDIAVKMPRTGFVAGHLIITSNDDAMIIEDLDEAVLTKMLTLANRLGGILFEALECDGTNLLVQNGVAAGQIDENVILHVIPRWEEDSLDLSWSSTELPQNRLSQINEQLSFAEEQGGQATPRLDDAAGQDEPVDVEDTGEDEVIDGADNYYAKQFKRGFE